MLAAVREDAKLDGDEVDVILSIDSTIVRAHQHAAGARRDSVAEPADDTGQDRSTNSRVVPGEPPDHALGLHRGGLSARSTPWRI